MSRGHALHGRLDGAGLLHHLLNTEERTAGDAEGSTLYTQPRPFFLYPPLPPYFPHLLLVQRRHARHVQDAAELDGALHVEVDMGQGVQELGEGLLEKFVVSVLLKRVRGTAKSRWAQGYREGLPELVVAGVPWWGKENEGAQQVESEQRGVQELSNRT